MTVLQLVGYNRIREQFITKLQEINDPQSGKPLFNSVQSIVPDIINPYSGILGIIRLQNVLDVRDRAMGGAPRVAHIEGAIFSFTQGKTEDSVYRVVHAADVLGAHLNNKDFLEIENCLVYPKANMAQTWTTLNLGANPENPIDFVFSMTSFKVDKQLENPINQGG